MSDKLHIGAGAITLPGWINIDNQAYPGVDHVLDIRSGLPFEDVKAVFAEHFIEHLTLAEAEEFLRECRRVLSNTGVLRLSTPNLDWVWSSHYRPPAKLSEEHALLGCLEINRAFHGWGHKFLYNFATLSELLRHCGFADITRCTYGQSQVPELRNLERHEVSPAFNGIDSLLIVDASGVNVNEDRSKLPELLEPYLRDFTVT
jgi:predicted SAM-dependent methyltransferase